MAKTGNYVQCPKCKQFTLLETGFFGGMKTTTCSHCGNSFSPKEHRVTMGHCRKCNRDFPYDQFDKKAPLCPRCGEALETDLNRIAPRSVTCPHCMGKMNLESHITEGMIPCEHCAIPFDVAKALNDVGPAATAPIIINHKAMRGDAVLWRHPRNEFAIDSKIVMDAGMVALIISGFECRSIVRESGKTLREALGEGNAVEYVNVAFMRLNLNNPLLYGGAVKQLQDSKYCLKKTAALSFHGEMYLHIENPETFAAKVNYKECTEAELGLTNPQAVAQAAEAPADLPKILLMPKEDMTAACQGEITAAGASIWEALSHRDAIKERFVKRAQDALLQEFGLAVTRSSLNGLEISRDMLEVMDNLALVKRVSGEIVLGAINATIHLKDRSEMRATLCANGRAQLRVDNLSRLQRHMDSFDWETSADEGLAGRTISKWITNHITNMLPAKLQQIINEANLEDIRDLGIYERSVIDYIQDAFANDTAYGYLYEHGLAMESLSLRLIVESLSLPLRSFYEVWDRKALNQADAEISKDDLDTRAAKDIHKANIDADVAIARNEALERVEQSNAQRDKARRERDQDARSEESRYRHALDMQSRRQQGEAQALADENQLSAARRTGEYLTLKDEQEQERKLRAARHEQALTEIMNSVEQSKLSFREKLDAYARLKQMEDALTAADVKRAEGAAASDIRRMSGETDLKLSREAQAMMDEAAKAQLERDLTMKRQELEAELQRLQAAEAAQQREMENRQRQQDMQQEIDKLKILASCYEKQLQSQADTAKATVTAEAIRAAAQLEYENKRQEQQHKEEEARLERQDKEEERRLEKDRVQMERVLDEIRHLQDDLKWAGRSENGYRDGSLRKIDEIERRLDDLLRQLDRASDRATRREDLCPACGAKVTPRDMFCPACGERIKR